MKIQGKQLIPVNVPIFVQKVNEHHLIKDEIMGLIKETKQRPGETMSTTDWFEDYNYKRPYWEPLLFTIDKYMRHVADQFNVTHFSYDNYWFQTYTKGDKHCPHVHPGVHYTNVYYLDMPGDYGSGSWDPMDKNKVLDVKIEEGDLLSLPGQLMHDSPEILDNTSKTIIGFNINFQGNANLDTNYRTTTN